jgi:hypothetical protein
MSAGFSAHGHSHTANTKWQQQQQFLNSQHQIANPKHQGSQIPSHYNMLCITVSFADIPDTSTSVDEIVPAVPNPEQVYQIKTRHDRSGI